MKMRTILVSFPEELPLENVKQLVIFAVEESYAREMIPSQGGIRIFDTETLENKPRHAPLKKSKQQLFEEIFNAALSQFKEKYGKCAILDNNLIPEKKRFISTAIKMLKNDPILLKTLIDAGITLEKGNEEFILTKLEENDFGALPSILKLLRMIGNE